MNLRDLILQIESLGYNDEDATARVCQDIVLKGIAQSKINNVAFLVCMDSFVFNDPKMRENNMADVYKRLSKIFQDKSYKSTVDKSDKRWLDDDIDVIFDRILKFINSLNK